MDYCDAKYFYERAIEERRHHQKQYNHWMNMYSIFTAALFVALYTLFDQDGKCVDCARNCEQKVEQYKDLLIFVVLSLGTLVGWCWYASCWGYRRWNDSWIKLVQYWESVLDSKHYFTPDGFYVYRVFVKSIKDEVKDPFSTQMLTIFVVLVMSIFWSVGLLYFLLGIFCSGRCVFLEENSTLLSIGCLVFVILLVFAIFAHLFREDLSKSHRILDSSAVTNEVNLE